MGRLWLALRAFFAVLGSAARAAGVKKLLAGTEEPVRPTAAPAPVRSEALSLLAALQREGRLVDFLEESIAGYSDAEVGAAARALHAECAAALERMFGLEPLAREPEGAEVTVPEGFDPARYRLSGAVGGKAPYRGRLRHHGWRATRCQVPAWTGSPEAALVVAAMEVEIGGRTRT